MITEVTGPTRQDTRTTCPVKFEEPLKPAPTCVNCSGQMPPPAGRGRPAIYCSGACRKAAHEARRTGKPDAFTVKIVEQIVTEERDLTECVARVTASPAACRRVLHALAQLARDGGLTSDPKWALHTST